MVLRSKSRARQVEEVDEPDDEEGEVVYVRFEGESSWHELPGDVYVEEDDETLRIELTDEQLGFLLRRFADAKGGRLAAGAAEGFGRVATDFLRDYIHKKGEQR